MTEPLAVAAELLHLIGAAADVVTLAGLLVLACPAIAVWLWRRTA